MSLTAASPTITLYKGGIMPGSAVVTAAPSATYPAQTFQLGTDYTEDDVTGTLTWVPTSQGGRIQPGQPLQATYVPQPVSRSTLEGRPPADLGLQRDVPSTARPDGPVVVYSLPAFSFSGPSEVGTGLQQSARLGGGIRVYLDRPWWSSGGGELLAVVLAHDGSATDPYFTKWGADPFSLGSGFASPPTLSAFPLAVGISSQFTGLTIPEDPRPVYDVAAHEVRYDAARRLWCCDIHVDAPQSYFPFVRLALARLQPNSIGGVELSKVVTLDCSQTSPDRTTLVDQSVAGSVGVTVTGPVGPGNRSSAANPVFTVSMWARLEQLQPGYADDLGWQAVSGSSVQLTEGAPVEGGSIVSWTGSIEPLPAAGTTRVVVWEQQDFGGSDTMLPNRVVFLDAIQL